MQAFIRIFIPASVVLVTAFTMGCNSNSAPGTCTDCSTITPANFVAALVQLGQSGQIDPAYANSLLVKASSLQPGMFIIWDGETKAYEAVNINTTPNLYGATESSVCSANGSSCSNLNPTAAAEAFVGASGEPHTTVVAEPTGSVSVVNGTQFGSTFGQMNYLGSNGPGTFLVNNVGSVTYFPVTPDNAVNAPNGGQVYQDIYNDGLLYSIGSQTKDTELQKARLGQAIFKARAQRISQQFGMSLQAATQLTVVAQKVQGMMVQGQMTAEDRDAIAKRTLGIAGVSTDEVNNAIAKGLQGDDSVADDVMLKAAQNLGMSDPSSLRDKLLPALGLQL